jgi:hypothetical protein
MHWYTNDSIQDAVNAASDNDTITVKAGNYAGFTVWIRGNLFIAAEDGAIISGGVGTGIFIGWSGGITIQGFQIEDTYNDGIGIWQAGNIRIVSNQFSTHSIAAINLNQATDISIKGNEFAAGSTAITTNSGRTPAANNWWGHAAGPSGSVADACNPDISAEGSGAAISISEAGEVCFAPWLTSADASCTDADADGYPSDNATCGPAKDCDDDDEEANPGAAEICDGIDNDCDGDTDEGCDESPVSIGLSYLAAWPSDREIIIEWSTESEVDNAGFNLYRAVSEDSGYIKINDSLIPAEGSPSEGASYEFIDDTVQNRKTYYYKLEDIDLNGETTDYGLVKATPKLIYKFKSAE